MKQRILNILVLTAIILWTFSGLCIQASQLSPSIWDRSVSISGASAQILPSDNGSRRYLLIQNACVSNIGISVDSTAASIAAAGTVTLFPGGSLEFKAPDVPQNAFNAISATGTCAVTIWEVR